MSDKPRQLHDAHLHPLTLAFDEGLRSGAITLEVAAVFVERVYDAWLEAKVRANPRLLKDPLTAGAYRQIQVEAGNVDTTEE